MKSPIIYPSTPDRFLKKIMLLQEKRGPLRLNKRGRLFWDLRYSVPSGILYGPGYDKPHRMWAKLRAEATSVDLYPRAHSDNILKKCESCVHYSRHVGCMNNAFLYAYRTPRSARCIHWETNRKLVMMAIRRMFAAITSTISHIVKSKVRDFRERFSRNTRALLLKILRRYT